MQFKCITMGGKSYTGYSWEPGVCFMFSESYFRALGGTWWKVDSAAGGRMLTAAAIETLRGGPEGPDPDGHPDGHPDGQLDDLSSSHIGAGVMF